MTVTPDTAELAPTRDPAAYARRPLLTGGFWVMMAFCVLCLLAAVAVVMLGPRMSRVKHAVAAAAPAAAPASPTRPPLATQLAAPAPASPDETGLAARVQRLEAGQSRVLAAAAGALAAASLSDAAAKPAPFAADLAAVARVIPGSPDAAALAMLAPQGAPTRPALATELTALGAEVSTAARAPGKNASFMDRALYAVARVVSLRRIDVKATGADSILARAERAADNGDLEGAVRALDALPDQAKASLAPWRDKAERRIEIDQHIAGLRAAAVANLAAAQQASAGAPP
jgi:hypothetical protein